MNTFGSGRSADSGYLAPARVNDLSRKDSSISEGSAPDSLLDLYGPNRSGISSIDYGERKGTLGDIYDENDPESSRWIHRDKLAFCVAKGVLLDQTRGEGQKHTAMHCKMRNFTEGKIHDPSLKDVVNTENFHRGFYDTSVGCQLENWDIEARDENVAIQGQSQICDAEHNDGKWTILVKRENHPNFWHKLLEIWNSMLMLDVLTMSINPATNKPYLTEADIPNIQVVFTEYDAGTLNPVDDWWPLVTGNMPIMQRDMDPTCLGNVILPLPESASPFWGYTWDEGDCHEPFLINAFLRRLYRHIGLEEHYQVNKTEQTVVTIIDRKKTRKLASRIDPEFCFSRVPASGAVLSEV